MKQLLVFTIVTVVKLGSLQSLDWAGGLEWWSELNIIFMLSNETVGLHLET